MNQVLEIRLAAPVAGLNAFLEPHRQWIEGVIGGEMSDAITFEVEMPLGQLVAEDLLKGALLDRQCLCAADGLRPAVARWELPPGVSPKIQLFHSREQSSPIMEKTWAWDPHWQETPVAVWMHGLKQALITASIPYVTYSYGPRDGSKDWLIVNRAEAAPALNLLSSLIGKQPKKVMKVIGGKDVPLPSHGFDWDRLALDPRILELVKRDLEFFFQREAWFRKSGLPFRRELGRIAKSENPVLTRASALRSRARLASQPEDRRARRRQRGIDDAGGFALGGEALADRLGRGRPGAGATGIGGGH